MARQTEPRYTPLPGPGNPPKWAPEDAPQENRMRRPEDREPPDPPAWHPEDMDGPRQRGRPTGEPTANVHLLVPVDLLKRFDAKRGDVPRLTMIRRLMQAWVDQSQ